MQQLSTVQLHHIANIYVRLSNLFTTGCYKSGCPGSCGLSIPTPLGFKLCLYGLSQICQKLSFFRAQTSHNIYPLFPYLSPIIPLLFFYIIFVNDNNVIILDNRVLPVQIVIDNLHHYLHSHHHHCQWLVQTIVPNVFLWYACKLFSIPINQCMLTM